MAGGVNEHAGPVRGSLPKQEQVGSHTATASGQTGRRPSR
jgi:hypothetical protein